MAPSSEQWIASFIGISTLAWWWKIRFVDIFALRFTSLVEMVPRIFSYWLFCVRPLFLSLVPRLIWHCNVVLVDWPRVLHLGDRNYLFFVASNKVGHFIYQLK